MYLYALALGCERYIEETKRRRDEETKRRRDEETKIAADELGGETVRVCDLVD
jgi:hypothetical protein